jgi:hypothetical protein
MRFVPVSGAGLGEELAARLLEMPPPPGHPLRVAFDTPLPKEVRGVADTARDALVRCGRPAVVVSAQMFYRDASLRYEYGKTDTESFFSGWLDVAALQREVLLPLGRPNRPGALFRFLPSLRDPVSNRSTRVDLLSLPAHGVLLVMGQILLAAPLSFDVTVHFAVSRAGRRRRFDADSQWQLPAFDRYDIDVNPAGVADFVVRYDDPLRPALGVAHRR